MTDALELYLIDESSAKSLIALGRRDDDTAIEHLPIDKSLAALRDTGKAIGNSVLGNTNPLSDTDLGAYGDALFAYLFRGGLHQLYQRLPQGPVTLQILSNRPEICEVPWEFLRTPDRQPCPNRERMVVRIHPTCGKDSPRPARLKRIRVLLVSADPTDQVGIEWPDIQQAISRAFSTQMPDNVSIKVVPGANRLDLMKAIAGEQFDIFHFYGHGVLRNGVGNLVLQDVRTRQSDYLPAAQLAIALQGKGIRLAVLSACLSGAGNFSNDFGTVATALISAGIPAVIANQFPIPIKSVSPFVGGIYQSLMSTGNIDGAVADGRAILAVGMPGNTAGKVEWGIPTLYRLPDAKQLFEVPV